MNQCGLILSSKSDKICTQMIVNGKMLCYIENSKLCFRDMKIMSRRNGGDLVNNESAGQVVYQNHHHS